MNYIKILKKIEEKQDEIMVDRFYGDDFTAKKAAWITKSDRVNELLIDKIIKIWRNDRRAKLLESLNVDKFSDEDAKALYAYLRATIRKKYYKKEPK